MGNKKEKEVDITEKIKGELEKIREKYALSKEEMNQILEEVNKRKDEIERYIRDNPFKAVVIALLAGIILGKVLRR